MSEILQTGLPVRAAKNMSYNSNGHRIPIVALGMSLSLLFAVTFVVCVVFDLLFPAMAMHEVWLPLLPGVTWLSWQSFILGLAESAAYGWYVALIFGPLFNLFASQHQRGQGR